jgi:hypothetical protein
MIYTPCLTGQAEVENLNCMLETTLAFNKKGWPCSVKYTVRDSIIPRARNMALAEIYANKSITDLIMIDDDVRWEAGAIMRLLSHDCDVVMGAYPKKVEPIQFPVKMLPGETPDTKTGLMKIRGGPAGFMRISRRAIERMIEAYPQRVYRDPNVSIGKAWALFMLELGPDTEEVGGDGMNELWGEDFTFCRLWRELGGDVWLDTVLTFQHWGRKAYEGCYADHLPFSMLFDSQQRSAA